MRPLGSVGSQGWSGARVFSDGGKDDAEKEAKKAEDEAGAAEAQASSSSSSESSSDEETSQTKADLARLEKDLEEAQATAKDARETALRLAADMENLRARTRREVDQAKAFALQSFVRDILEVPDNLTRAMDAVPEEVKTGGAAKDGVDYFAQIKSLYDGVKMVDAVLLKALSAHGVQRAEIGPGGVFDPNTMNALFEIPDPSKPNKTVGQVIKAGYSLNGRIVRPSEVGVFTGGPEPEAEEPEGKE
ncbi:unnamed protein product [Pedinophyceae sp. YPF-701]|nr:unnamed protein product [Pedinophyceae sp. YPF-701]